MVTNCLLGGKDLIRWICFNLTKSHALILKCSCHHLGWFYYVSLKFYCQMWDKIYQNLFPLQLKYSSSKSAALVSRRISGRTTLYTQTSPRNCNEIIYEKFAVFVYAWQRPPAVCGYTALASQVKIKQTNRKDPCSNFQSDVLTLSKKLHWLIL